MATKIKLLYDISLQISASQKAGLYRVADELFCRLAAHPEIEIYPCVGTTKGCARDYLSDCGLLHLLERTVTLPHLRFAVKRELFGVRCKENLFRILYQHKYTEILSAFDIYFSPFLPVSPFRLLLRHKIRPLYTRRHSLGMPAFQHPGILPQICFLDVGRRR